MQGQEHMTDVRPQTLTTCEPQQWEVQGSEVPQTLREARTGGDRRPSWDSSSSGAWQQEAVESSGSTGRSAVSP